MIIYLLLPAYNEESAIPKLLVSIDSVSKRYNLNIKTVVVDDGSSDKTAETVLNAISGLAVELVRHSVNQGLGITLNTGIRHILEIANKEDLMVVMDADNTHSPAQIPELIDKSNKGADVVIASRYAKGGKEFGVPLHRRMLSMFASVLFQLRFRIKGVTDFTCGYRLYKMPVIHKMNQLYKPIIEERSFACSLELLLKAASAGARFAEIPMELRYDNKQGESKMKIVQTIMASFKLLSKKKPVRSV